VKSCEEKNKMFIMRNNGKGFTLERKGHNTVIHIPEQSRSFKRQLQEKEKN